MLNSILGVGGKWVTTVYLIPDWLTSEVSAVAPAALSLPSPALGCPAATTLAWLRLSLRWGAWLVVV